MKARHELTADPLSVIALRSKPRVILLDDDLRILFAGWPTMFALLRLWSDPTKTPERLPEPISHAVREAVHQIDVGTQGDVLLEALPEIYFRVSVLSGPSGRFIALFMEDRARRNDVSEAAKRFQITRREEEVLVLMLQGRSGREIAMELGIARSTVNDYFKKLIRKTGARNRTDMIARVLGWMERGRVSDRELSA